jgi:hypothetical protein
MDAEIDGGEQHEGDGHGLHEPAVEITNAGVVRRETTGRHGSETMGNSVEQGHARQPVAESAGQSQSKVDSPKGTRRSRQPGS